MCDCCSESWRVGSSIRNPGYMQARGAKVSEELHGVRPGEDEGQGNHVLRPSVVVASMLLALNLQSGVQYSVAGAFRSSSATVWAVSVVIAK